MHRFHPPVRRLVAILALMLFPSCEEEIAVAEVPIAGAGWIPADQTDRTAALWVPQEWNITDPSWSGNPFDVVATVTFVHTGSGGRLVTQMFYDGNDVWKWRFTGTLTGEWKYTTESEDPELHGEAGRVEVIPNPDPDFRGFLITDGNRYGTLTDSAPRAFRLNIYMNERDFGFVDSDDQLPSFDAQRINAYIDDAQQYGFETIFVHVCNHWFNLGTLRHSDHSSTDPDPRTFRILERIITTAHARRVRVHLWAWGDETRQWTPTGVGGINGVPDKRLQRYIAARLGPLPGWSMGYGFDLHEWVTEPQLLEWATYLNEHLGWKHLLWARDRSNLGLDVVSYPDSRLRSYEEVVDLLDADTRRPHLLEERDTLGRIGMAATRRGLWRYAMAGGMGGWWGFFASDPDPYPRPEVLLTNADFFRDRFRRDLVRANELTDGVALKSPGSDRFLFYEESTSSIQLDLSAMPGPQPAVAVDADAAYAEIDLGSLAPANQTWNAPYQSDWAIAVGSFDD